MLLSLSDYPTWDDETIDEVSEEAETNETTTKVKSEEATKDVDLTEMEERIAKKIYVSLAEQFEARLKMEKARHEEQVRNLEEKFREQSVLKDAKIKQLKENNSKRVRGRTEQFREQIPAFWEEQKAKRIDEVAKKRGFRQRPWDSACEVVLDGVIERINHLRRVRGSISLEQSELIASLIDETMKKVYSLCEMTSSLGIDAYTSYLVASKRVLKKEIELMDEFKHEDKKCDTSNRVGTLCEELSRTCKLASMRMEEAAETIKNMGDEDVD